MYQFFDYSDHDTVCVRNSNNPEFHDHKTFPVPMTPELDQYLRVTVSLQLHLNIGHYVTKSFTSYHEKKNNQICVCMCESEREELCISHNFLS